MESIENYKSDLMALCGSCKSKNRCKEHTKLCFVKKFAWRLAYRKWKKESEGLKRG